MITVRFPNGFSVQYNSANYAERTPSYTDIYDKKGGSWIAQVPTAACILEIKKPCRMYIAERDKAESLEQLVTDMEAGAFKGTWLYKDVGDQLAKLKSLLARFDARKKVMQ